MYFVCGRYSKASVNNTVELVKPILTNLGLLKRAIAARGYSDWKVKKMDLYDFFMKMLNDVINNFAKTDLFRS